MIERVRRVFPYLLLLPAVLPLIYFGGLLYPYLAPKTLSFRADAILAVGMFLALVFSRNAFYVSRLRNPSAWIPAALVAVAYVSSIVGVDFYHSFWSIFDRGDGLLTLTCIVALFYATLLTADGAFMQKILKWVAFVASLCALFALLQWLQTVSGMDVPLIPTASGRLSGTLGNAAYLASYLGMTLFVTLAITPSLRGTWRTYAYWGGGLQLLAIVGTATRGSLLALVFAGLLALVYVAWRGGAYRAYGRAGVAALLILVGLFFAFRTQLAQSPFVPVARVASISLSDATVESRLFIWRSVLAEPFARPLGYGAEHIQVLFNQFYDPTALIEQWFDRTHNAFLDYFVQYGFAGLALYIALIVVYLRASWRVAHSSAVDRAWMGKMFLLLGVVYVVQNMFVFDSVVTLWLFVMLLAALAVFEDASRPTPVVARRFPSSVPLGVALVVALLIIPVSLTPLRANFLLADAYRYHLSDVEREIAAVQKGYDLGTYADIEYGYQLYDMYTARQMTQLSGEEKILAYRLAREILAKNYARYPYDARTTIYYAHVLDVSPRGEAVDEALLKEVLEHAVALSPKRMQSQYLMANISIRKGDAYPVGSAERRKYYDEGIRVLSAYAATLRGLAEPRFIIAGLYQSLGELVVAAQWAEEGRTVYRSDENTARRAARYYIGVEDWNNARYFLQEVVNLSDVKDYNYLYDLAKAEFLAGNVDRAKEIVAEIEKSAPGVVQSDPAFLEAISK